MGEVFLGVDGGGTGLRAALVRFDARNVPIVVAQADGPSANPNAVGRDAAAARVQAVVRAVLDQADTATVTGAGVGIAGAAADHAEEWIRAVMRAALPGVPVVPSADHEIALVGALGERDGVLVLAGTGSVVYGMRADGLSAQAGGWGFLLGDEGGGFWLGRAALQATVQHADGLAPNAARLAAHIRQRLGLTRPRDVVAWLYRAPVPVADVAALAADVLALADDGDVTAQGIVAHGAATLAAQTGVVVQRLGLAAPRIAFTGGLLTRDTPLAHTLCTLLSLPERPQALYPPVLGAALLARLTHVSSSSSGGGQPYAD